MTKESDNVHYLDLDLSSINTDVTFKFYVSNGHGDLGRNDDATENFDLSSASSFTSYGHKGGSNTWTLKHSTSKYAKYKITAEWKSASGNLDYWDIKIEGTEEKSSGGDTPTTGDNNFYLVGNFMSTDGNNASDINYNNKIFRMKYIGNNQYSFDVPATLTVYSQILSVNGSTTQAYGPSSNQTSGPSNDGTINGTLTSASAKTNNYWQMYDRGISSDGMYTYTITVDGNGVPTNWSIKHTQLTRVVYYLPKDGLAQPAYMTRSNSSSAGDNKYFGNVYLKEGQECFVLGNIKGMSAWTDGSKPMPTVTKLYKQGNGGGYAVGTGTNPSTHPSGYDDWHKVYPALSSGFKVTPAGAMTLEYNPSKGQDEKEAYSGNNNIGGEVIRAAGDPMTIIESLKVVGPGVGTDWMLSSARPMTYNETLKCWEITITTTNAASTANLFRFVANDSWNTNWYEDGTSDAVKAKIPYTDSGDGHAATDEDPNVVERTDDAHTATARDIIFNRPAGNWTIRFYTETISSSGGNSFTYNYYYTITENTDPDATLTPGTDGGNYDFDNYTTGTPETETLNVTLSNATKYAYAIGNSSVTLDESSTKTDGSFTLTYDGTKVTDGFGNVVTGNTVYVKIQGQDASDKKGTTHTYQYTFNEPVVSTLDFTPKSGFFINKAVITVTDGTAPYTYTIKDASDKVLSTGTSSSATFTISTPGYLTVTDKDGNSATATGTDKFDFTYSTSENYANYYNNGTTAQSVAQEGGKDATNIFLKKADYENMRIYAWDYTYDQLIQKYQKGETTDIDSELSALGLKKRTSESNWKDIWENGKFIRSEQGTGDGYTHTYNDTRAGYLERDPLVMLTEPYPGTLMSDTRSIKIDGEEYYYLTLPLNRLHPTDDRKVGIIVTRNDDNPTDLGTNADLYKTGDYKISSNSSFIYSSVKSGDKYNNSIVDISDAVAGTNVVFYKNTSNWSNVNIYLYGSGGEKTAWKDAPAMKKFDGNTYYYALSDNETWEHVVFSNNRSNSDKTIDLDYGGGRKMYEGKPDADHKGGTVRGEGNADYITYINNPSSYTVEVQNHPNGDDYLRAMPSDKTVLLDPTWGGVITPKGDADEESSVENWNGVTGGVTGYRKFVKQDLTQTIYGLDNSKTYTVQAIVRVWSNEGAKVSLKVGDGEAVTSKNYGASSISHVNKNGRVDEKYTQGPDLNDPYFIHYDTDGKQGFGWQKIEATGKPTAAGNLVVTLTFDKGTSVQYDLADVILLEDANTAGHYWTKIPDSEASNLQNGEIDMTNRDTYNAFSFFDRDKGNPNAIIKASNRTVIGLNKGIAYVQNSSNENVLDNVDHRQSRNTISQNSDGTWSGRYLYLYDESSNWSDCNAYGATVGFNMIGAKYDRQFTANQHSTMFLPFAVTTKQLKTAGFKELQMVDVDNVTSANIPLITWNLTKETPTSYTTTAGQGYIVIAGDNGASLSSFIKPTGGIDVQAANSALAKKTEAKGLVGAYVYSLRYQTEDAGGTTYMNYSYLNDKFRALATAAQGGAEIKPFRATFAVPTSVAGGARMLSTFIIDADEVFTPTGVDKLGVEEQLSGNIYTLDGRLVSTNGKLSELSRGIYVRGGRKIVVK